MDLRWILAIWAAGMAVNIALVARQVLKRRREGRSIAPTAPSDAAFAETGASGRWLGGGVKRFSGASNVLLVYVKNGALIVTPTFPFSLLPMPKGWGLDLDLPLSSIRSAETRQGVLGRTVVLHLADPSLSPLELQVRDRDGLLRALDGAPATAGAAARRVGGLRRTLTRAFLILWGSGAMLAGGSQLIQDARFRSEGQHVVGVVVGAAPDTTSALVAYSAEGERRTMVSSRGSGTWRAGQRVDLRYLPGHPEAAREEDVAWVALLFMVVGAGILLFVIFGERIARRVLPMLDPKPPALAR